MKTKRTLRILSLLAFLLLIAPFYDSCDGNYIHKVNADGTEIKIEKSFKEKAYNVLVDEEALNGFQIANFTFFCMNDSTFQEAKEDLSKAFQKKEWYKDLGLLISLLFDFIVLTSFLLLVLSFFKKQNLFNKLALINCILIIITFCYIIFLEISFHHWHQIKWGYYAFIITNLLIFYYSRKPKTAT